MTILIKDLRTILTLDEAGTKYRGASIIIEGPAVKAIVPNSGPEGIGEGCRSLTFEEVIDGSGMIAIPGMVNTHHHLYQTLTRNIPATADLPLFPWLTTLYDIWQGLTPEDVRISALVGLGELMKTGCTTSADHLYVFPETVSSEFIDLEIAAAGELGLRFHPTRGSMSLGRSRGGLPPDEVVQDHETILKDSERLVEAYHDRSRYSMCRLSLAPCSPFSVTPELMRDTINLARRLNVNCHTHLAETRDEEAFCLEKFGKRPVAYAADLGWVGPDVWFAHCVHLNPEEVAILGETRTGVAHCPVSNLKLSSGIAPILDLVRAGARVGLAVDGSASNDASDMWGEAKVAYLIQKLAHGPDGLTAEGILRMATSGGASTLGRDDIGVLAPGMAADIVLINSERLEFAGGLHDPAGTLISTGSNHWVDTVIVNGKVTVRNGHLTGVDEEAVSWEANRLSARLLEKTRLRTGRDYLVR